jgi:MazG family protein
MTRPITRPIDRLLAIMARLRSPEGGCAWDLEQTFATIAPYTIEEAYEVADAIARGDLKDLKEELGDLLLQVVFHARMAEEDGAFAFDDVATAIADKMVRRHPHVFAEAPGHTPGHTPESQTRSWEATKAAERATKSGAAPASALDGIALALPALMRADKLQRRAARVGFDWPEPRQVLDKIEEEIGELRAELDRDPESPRVKDEMGDLLFALVNLARHLNLDSEAVLRQGNDKFERRFRAVEAALAQASRRPEQASLEEMEALWRQVKLDERRKIDV